MADIKIVKKIYYHDTDCGGVVYYANYLKYLEEARTEYFTANQINLSELINQGTIFVVSSLKIDYRAPAIYQDSIEVSAKINKIKAASIIFDQKVTRANDILIEATLTLVCIDNRLKPKIIPDSIRKNLLP